MKTVAQRPAEATAIAAAVGGLLAKAFGVDDPDALTGIIVVVGAVPAGVTLAIDKIPRLRRWLGIKG